MDLAFYVACSRALSPFLSRQYGSYEDTTVYKEVEAVTQEHHGISIKKKKCKAKNIEKDQSKTVLRPMVIIGMFGLNPLWNALCLLRPESTSAEHRSNMFCPVFLSNTAPRRPLDLSVARTADTRSITCDKPKAPSVECPFFSMCPASSMACAGKKWWKLAV